ncbi:tRNA pseudouridine synthase B [Acidimicrobium ferrooxidans DSM 10331]|uniref:tRNA pseudouridine synthase B n=1 Tax=Acidimicrobium ferrooxidans (strain DSM 10331 / JCM 15462 / NBRC 103882 / ICP) TaxID=525909 RepID=C7LXY6_ACIFD|nr:tRNA pseudouridine(55) synthase TruB [Acidimicrobium ferrooxidans]ACU53594.1 tRNA pseudouridine synthase B [Acidimicrobium ferrooxidans DSM 10331]
MIQGIYLVDKPSGPTSHDVVARARRAFGTRRVGHAGTLDPMASGLLVLGVDRATRLLRYLEAQTKRYRAVALLGVATDTDDLDGVVVDRRPVEEPTREAVVTACRRFVPGYDQVPPAYSALHLDGERAYVRARRGEDVTLPRRRVRIDEIEVGAIWRDGGPGEPQGVRVELTVTCGPGTYLRSLVRDLGEALGTPATLASLRRERVGRLEVAQAVGLEDLERATPVPLPLALAGLGRVELDGVDATRFLHGQRIEAPSGLDEGDVLVGAEGSWLGVASCDGHVLAPRVVLVDAGVARA